MRMRDVPEPRLAIGPAGYSLPGSLRSPSRSVLTVTGLPSSQTQPIPGPLVSGVSDVAFLHGQLYGLLAGAGVEVPADTE